MPTTATKLAKLQTSIVICYFNRINRSFDINTTSKLTIHCLSHLHPGLRSSFGFLFTIKVMLILQDCYPQRITELLDVLAVQLPLGVLHT